MILATKAAPGASISAGLQTFTINLTTDLVLGQALLDAIKITVNDVEVGFSHSDILNGYALSFQSYITGSPDLKLRIQVVYTEAYEKTWMIQVAAEASIRNNDYVYSPYLEILAAYFPEYTKAASDKTSIFQQMMNPIALELDYIKQGAYELNKSLLINASNISDADWLSEYELSSNEQLSLYVDSAGEIRISPPTVYGIKGVNKIPLTYKSSFREFWTEALPTRWHAQHHADLTGALTPSTAIKSVAEIEPFRVPNTRLHINVHSATNLVRMVNEELTNTTILISGISDKGIKQTESVLLAENGVVATLSRWSLVEAIRLNEDAETTEGEIIVFAIPPRLSIKPDPLNRRIVSREQETIKYQVGDDIVSSYLDVMISGQGHLLDIAKGMDTFNVEERTRLANTLGEYVHLSDFTIDPFSNLIYGIDEENLYIWDRRNNVPSNLQRLTGATEDPEVGFSAAIAEPQTEDGGDVYCQVSIQVERPRATKLVKCWSWAVMKDWDDKVYLDVNNGLVGDIPFLKYNKFPITTYGISDEQFEVVLDNTGDYIFELEITFTDGTTEIVRRIVQVRKKAALAEYPVLHLIGDAFTANRVHISESGEVLASNGEVMYKLIPSYDLFIADPTGRRLLFREDYDAIEVRFDG